ncbi:hypothetical protein [Candidatus Contubernalis alkaliaceticus]|uniref:hypothetical protein n=1 Tax=Candidatus Contubernalis alkaliaceticus TaxID=338645 RepID=UPI001F4C16AB|nr:hypothetical protein [Candidatus Contubernalis alkalaceticus]UNC91117.1 hypothetical protein HUE98_02860 [Candidatus Contubernalis alkalaceticus]
MGRTESVSFQVHPKDEQSQIDLMQKFHWNMMSTQEIKTIDNYLEQRGDSIYQIKNSQHYIKLAFCRDLDLPNLDKIRELESEYHSIHISKKPDITGFQWFLMMGAFALTWGIFSSVAGFFSLILGFAAGYSVYHFLIKPGYDLKLQDYYEVRDKALARKQRIFEELDKLSLKSAGEVAAAN